MLHWFSKRLNELHEKNRDERGFTLIELLVVVIIIGILAAIAIPVFLGQRERAQDAQAASNARNALTAAKTFYTEQDSYNGMDATALEEIEPSLAYAAAPSGTDPSTIGFAVAASNQQVTLGVCSASGESFWIRSLEQGGTSGTFYARQDAAAGGGCNTTAPGTINGTDF